MGLFSVVVILSKGLCDDELGHVDFVLEEVRDGFFNVAVVYVSKKTC